LTALRQHHRNDLLGPSLENHPDRMHTVDGLGRLHTSSVDTIDQLQVHQALDGIHGRHDDANGVAGSQSALGAFTDPGVPVVLHDVIVVLQVVDVQQAVHGHSQY